MNVAVINLKIFSKGIIRIILASIILIMILGLIFSNISIMQKIFTFQRCSFLYTTLFTNTDNVKVENDYAKTFELFYPMAIAMGNEIKVDEQPVTTNTEPEEGMTISKTAQVEKVTERNYKENYNMTHGTVRINNQSDYDLSEDMLDATNTKISNNKKVLIYHTHTCESYTPNEEYNYTMTGNYRTTDNNFNVVRVGEELKKYLEKKNFTVVHNMTYNDYPSYSGSYNRSLTNIQTDLENNPDTDIVIDLHRDAVGDGASYGPTVKIDGKSVAQLMLVIGTSGGGLEHPNWNENLKRAIKLQEKANEMYPGLFRPIIIRNSRYNQHVRSAACIIEVGATGNTLDECLLSMQCLANILEDMF